MHRKKFIVIFLAFVLLVGLWSWLQRTPPTEATPDTFKPSPIASSNHQTAPVLPSVNRNALKSIARQLVAAGSTTDRLAALLQLRQALKSGTVQEKVNIVRQLLESKADGTTGLGFKIGTGGALLEAPTLRTWLLEELASLDSAAAASYAREVLKSSNSPDEWALALRNLARGDSSSNAQALLETKTAELLRNEAWRRDPSAGYLEAFDVTVYIGGTNLLAPLTEMVSMQNNRAVAHAAYLALDRLVINQSAQVLAAINDHPEWMTGREETRANYFARADLADVEQRRLVESYLLDSSRSPQELATFAGIFPNANFMISHNLLTVEKPLGGVTLRQRDQVALETVDQWLSDNRFEKLKPLLTTIQKRLGAFTSQSK